MRLLRYILTLSLLLGMYFAVDAQTRSTSDSPYGNVNEDKLIETKWKYTYALHVESNTTIHQADKKYEFFIYFKFDYSYRQFLNGKMTRGNWSLNGSELFYNFKHIKKFYIAEVSKERLVLEFTQPNSKGAYQYHFIPVKSEDAPFVVPANELPLVDVEGDDPRSIMKRKSKKKKKKKKRRGSDVAEVKPVYISIELIGGGFYGGIDPVLRDFVQIKSTGRLIKEFQSVQNGLIVTKKDIPRDELEAFAEYIVSKDFFEFDRIYDCDSEACMKRKKEKPTPIPLRLSVAYGQKKKVITITVWGRDRNNVQYVPYPKELDQIIMSIQKMASRLD